MGGSSKKVTVGYKYYIGMHMVLCHGPVDRIQRISVDERTAWQGFSAGGRININANNLFGGENREGGVSGAVDIDMGRPGQGRNSYLQARLGSNMPAFRGVVSAVLRQVYVGLNPYLKPWAFRLQRVFTRSGGAPQWYQERAPIGEVDPVALYIALDVSGSMNENDGGNMTRLEVAKEALTTVLSSFSGIGQGVPVDIMLVAWAGTVTRSILRRNVTSSDVTDFVQWVDNLVTSNNTNFEAAVSLAPDFFNGAGDKPRRVIFITDGLPTVGDISQAQSTLFGISGVQSYAFNINLSDISETAKMDNTPQDGVPVVSGSDPGPLVSAIQNALFALINLNPAHIIHECLTDSDWGMGYLAADLDDASFRAAADQLVFEAMGMSILWDRQMPLEDFIQEVCKHIDGVLRVNRRTGKFELKLVRDDYDEEDLLLLDESNIERLTEFSRPTFGELVNSVTVNYWDGRSGTDASVTVQDLALTEAQRGTVNTTIQYPGFTGPGIASRVAERDMRTLSTPMVGCTIYVNREARDLNVGDPFKLSWADYGIQELVMRVTQIAYGDGRSNKIKIVATQDSFAFPEQMAFEQEPPDWQDPSEPPQAAQLRLVTEMPYYELVQRVGQTALDVELNTNPETGYIMVSAGKPTDAHINARMATDSGGSVMEEVKVIDFCPVATLAEELTANPEHTVVTFDNAKDVDLVTAGPWAYIGAEMVAVKGINLTTGELTLGRGVLDTVPAHHEAGTPIFFADEYVENDDTEYVQSDSVQVAILPVTGQGSIALAAAPVDTVEVNARAIRPYPPGNLRIDGDTWPNEDLQPAGNIAVEWSHRDRTQQTAPSFVEQSASDIGPENGTTYTIRLFDRTDENAPILLREVAGIVNTEYTYTLQDQTDDGQGIAPQIIGLQVWSERDGWLSWQSQDRTIARLPAEGAILFVGSTGTEYQASTTDIPFTLPSNTEEGDLALVFVMHRSPLTTVPSGWQLVQYQPRTVSTSTGNHDLSVYSKYLEEGESSAIVTFQQQTAQRGAAHALVYRSASAQVIVDSNDGRSGTGLPYDVSVTGDDTEMKIGVVGITWNGEAGNVQAPASYSLTTPSNASGNRLGVAWRRLNGDSTGGQFEADILEEFDGRYHAQISLVISTGEPPAPSELMAPILSSSDSLLLSPELLK